MSGYNSNSRSVNRALSAAHGVLLFQAFRVFVSCTAFSASFMHLSVDQQLQSCWSHLQHSLSLHHSASCSLFLSLPGFGCSCIHTQSGYQQQSGNSLPQNNGYLSCNLAAGLSRQSFMRRHSSSTAGSFHHTSSRGDNNGHLITAGMALSTVISSQHRIGKEGGTTDILDTFLYLSLFCRTAHLPLSQRQRSKRWN